MNGQGPGGGFGYEIGKSNGGGSYGGMGTGGLNGGVPGVTYGDDSITHLLGGSGGGHSIVGSGNSGGGGGAISFKVNGSFDLGTNGVISVRGGAGQSDSDASELVVQEELSVLKLLQLIMEVFWMHEEEMRWVHLPLLEQEEAVESPFLPQVR